MHNIIEKAEPCGAKVFHNNSMPDKTLNMKSSLLPDGCRLGWLPPRMIQLLFLLPYPCNIGKEKSIYGSR